MLLGAAAGVLPTCPAPAAREGTAGTPGLRAGGEGKSWGGVSPGSPCTRDAPRGWHQRRRHESPRLSSQKRSKLLFHLRPAPARQGCAKPGAGARPAGAGTAPAAAARSQARRSCPSSGLAAGGIRLAQQPRRVASGEGGLGGLRVPHHGCPHCMKPSPAPLVLAQCQRGILGMGGWQGRALPVPRCWLPAASPGRGSVLRGPRDTTELGTPGMRMRILGGSSLCLLRTGL